MGRGLGRGRGRGRYGVVVGAGVVVLALAATGFAAAAGDGDTLEICVKKDRVKAATDDKPCEADEESLTLATGEAVDALSASTVALGNLVDRLHGGNVAYIDDAGGAGSGPAVDGVGAFLAVCPLPDDFENEDCDWDDPATAVLLVEGLDGDDTGTVVTFDDGEVAKAIAMLTDSTVDRIEVRHFPGTVLAGGGSGLSTTDVGVFRDQAVYDPLRPTALEGVPVSDIVLEVRRIVLVTENGTSSYSWTLRWYLRL